MTARGRASDSALAETLDSNRVLTAEQVAHLVQVSRKTVMRAIAAGDLEASQLAERGAWRINERAISRWMEYRSNRIRPRRPPADVGRVEATPAPIARRTRGSRTGDDSGMLAVSPRMGRAA